MGRTGGSCDGCDGQVKGTGAPLLLPRLLGQKGEKKSEFCFYSFLLLSSAWREGEVLWFECAECGNQQEELSLFVLAHLWQGNEVHSHGSPCPVQHPLGTS